MVITNHISGAVIHGTVIQAPGGSALSGDLGAVANGITGAQVAGLVLQAGALDNLSLGDDENAPGAGQGPQAR
ncbi:hypothetical protein [Kitasatospora sp. MY 5-36]|uniref:hypothetical protein n=1 Tax=Kitasatospora sp. MY 5-36 TaxID=1678027 RepID=UPI0006715636|nr:hypothetical protein [Kitasatospora sp. MY 5-36]